MNFAFNPTRFEVDWLPVYLGYFADDEWFTTVLYRVKGGKEATVYCCEAHPSTGMKLLAAKVYRPRTFRTMRNDAIYQEGRAILDEEGKVVRDQRSHRAIRRKSRLGRRLGTVSWLQHEFQTMSRLYEADADIPKPLAFSEHAILMEYIGDEQEAAPTLHDVSLAPEEPRPLFERLMHNVELFLTCDRIHADLSAFNVLYWHGDGRIIDFPQAVDATTNPHAFALLLRDIERLCQYFARCGVITEPLDVGEDLWKRYVRGEL